MKKIIAVSLVFMGLLAISINAKQRAKGDETKYNLDRMDMRGTVWFSTDIVFRGYAYSYDFCVINGSFTFSDNWSAESSSLTLSTDEGATVYNSPQYEIPASSPSIIHVRLKPGASVQYSIVGIGEKQ